MGDHPDNWRAPPRGLADISLWCRGGIGGCTMLLLGVFFFSVAPRPPVVEGDLVPHCWGHHGLPVVEGLLGASTQTAGPSRGGNRQTLAMGTPPQPQPQRVGRPQPWGKQADPSLGDTTTTGRP